MIEVVQAFDRTSIARLDSDDAAALDRKIEAARRLFADRGAWLKPHHRIEILRNTAALMEGMRDHLGRQIAREGGKPLTDALIETDRAIDGVCNAAEELRIMGGREIPMGLTPASVDRRAFTIVEPIGIVAAISVFNLPLNLIVHQVVPAIAVSCPVIVKPAPATPLSCIDFVGPLHEAGLPPDWCQTLISELYRFQPRRLVSPLQAAAGDALRVGAWWRRPGDHRPECRPRPADRAADEGWLLPCRPGLCVGAADLCPCGSRERVSRPVRGPCGGIEGRTRLFRPAPGSSAADASAAQRWSRQSSSTRRRTRKFQRSKCSVR